MKQEASFLALLRSQLYAVLMRGFAPPQWSVREWQADTDYTHKLASALEALPGGKALAAATRALAQARTEMAAEGKFAQLRRDTVELFANLRSQRFPPYETEYTGGGDFRKNQDLADLMGFYRAFGLDLNGSEERRERPDHIGVELEFLHFLCWKEAQARAAGEEEPVEVCVEAEQKFLRDHLGQWAEVFACGVEKTAPEPYFPAWAALLRAVVSQEAQNLQVALNPIKVPPPRPREDPEPISCGADATSPLIQIQGRE